MRVLIAEKLSPHKYKTPEGYLICQDAILARTGKQTYLNREVYGDSIDNPDKEIEIDRPEAEVFSDKTLASFENKPVTIEHPDEDVNIDNHNFYSVGFVRDIKRGIDNGKPVMIGTLVVTNPDAVADIENGKLLELSCGYDCDIVDNAQTNIRGNHVALCEHGRAGNARIIDSTTSFRKDMIKGEKSMNSHDDLSCYRAGIIDSKFKDFDDTTKNIRVVKEFIEQNGNKFNKRKDADAILEYIKKRTGIANADYGDVLYIIKEYTRAEITDSVKDAKYVIMHPRKNLYLTVGAKTWSDESDPMIKKFDSEKEAEEYAKKNISDFRIAVFDSVKDAMFEICYIDDGDVCVAIEAKDENDARQKFRRRYGMYYIKHIRKVKDGVKDMKVSHDNIREQPVFVMQSDVDKNLFFYIGKTHAMKEGEWTYAQYDMEGMTPDELRKELEANGWHKVARGPAPFIDEDPYEESTKGLKEAEKNLHDKMICNTETDCKDAKTEYVFNYQDTYHRTRDKMRVDANNLDEAIREFGKTMALGGFGTANIYVVSVSPNDGYIRAYGKLSEMLKQNWTRDSVKKLDSKKLLSIVGATKAIKTKDAKETKLTFVPTNDFTNIDMTNAMMGKLASSGIDYHSAKQTGGKYSVVILGGDDVVRKAKLVIENIGFFSKWS